MSCECKKLVGDLLIKGHQLLVKYAEATVVIERLQLDIVTVMNDYSENTVTRAWQKHRIAEFKARIAGREAQIARYDAELAGIYNQLDAAMESMRRCTMDKALLASVFGGAGVVNLDGLDGIFAGDALRITHLGDFNSEEGLATLLNKLRNSRRRPSQGTDTDDATSGLIGDVESIFAGMRRY
jgi:hypothetical protein